MWDSQLNISYDSSKVQALLEKLSDEDPELGVALYAALVKILLIGNPKKYCLAFDCWAQLVTMLGSPETEEPLTDP